VKAEVDMNSSPANEKPFVSGSAADEVPPIHTIHDDVESWTDTCSCEPEPRWQAVAEELERAARSDRVRDATHDGGAG
jgi:hypothetical protein